MAERAVVVGRVVGRVVERVVVHSNSKNDQMSGWEGGAWGD